MFSGIQNAGSLFASVAQVPLRHPATLAPLLIVWCVYAPVTVYLYFYFPWADISVWRASGAIFAAIVLISYMVSLASFILLEQIRLIETGKTPGLARPLAVAFSNSLRALHVTLIWALLWFLISLAEAILSPRDRRDDFEPSTQTVARVLAGGEGASISGAVFEALNQGVRMLAFLIFPAIAWERHAKPIRRGLGVALAHKTEFASGFALTWMAAGVVFLPPAFVFTLSEQTDVPFADWVWYAVILYSGLAWSFTMLLEQLFTAELYLWDMKWREACEQAGPDAPTIKLRDVPRPSILDGVSDMTAG